MTATASKWRQELAKHCKGVHPAADVFSMMGEAELADLGEDIRKNGLAVPMVLWMDANGDRWLLDGRNRMAAMVLAGVTINPFWFQTFSGDPYTAVITCNLKRRHLSFDQRAAIAAELAKMMAEEGRQARKSHLKQGTATPVRPRTASREPAAEQAAKQLDVGKTVVKEVLAAEKAKPGTIEKLKKGEAKVAEVRARKPKRPSRAEVRRAASEIAEWDAVDWAMDYILGKQGREELTAEEIQRLIARLQTELQRLSPGVSDNEHRTIGPYSVHHPVYERFQQAMEMATVLIRDGADSELSETEKALLSVAVGFIGCYEDEYAAAKGKPGSTSGDKAGAALQRLVGGSSTAA